MRYVLQCVISICLASLLSAVSYAANISPVGYWRTIDDHSHKPRSIVKLSIKEGALVGHIEKIFYGPGEGPNDVCKVCRGKNHNKPIVGMTILWNMYGKGNYFSGGRILDPKSGKIYRCNLTLMDNGERLKVRGYIGISLFGRSQVWERVPKVG